MGGGAATGGGVGTGGGSPPTGGGGIAFVDFGGGWVVPTEDRKPALVGTGGTTVIIGSGADSTAPTKFGGSGSGGAINVVYPPSGVMLPPNTNTMEFHFIPAAGQTLFRFTFQAPTTTLVVYTGCTPLGPGCVFTPQPSFWSDLVAYARGTAPVSWTVSGVDGSAMGNPIGSSSPQEMAFTEQDLRGGLYYWSIKEGFTGSTTTVQRFDYGFPNAPRQTYLTQADVGGTFCVGCHVISRQGNKIAVGRDIPSPSAYSLLTVPTRATVNSTSGPINGAANFFSFSPDERHLLTSDGNSIQWRVLTTGFSVPVTNPGSMPDWAPDGLHMVYAKPPSAFPVASLGVQSASLKTMHFNGTGWDAPVELVPFTGSNNYYPSYSPDGEWVLFNRSPRNAESSSNAAVDKNDGGIPDGELWAVPATGGTPLRLSKASDPGPSSWPKWAPVKHDYADGKVMWLTFSSARPYGLRLNAHEVTQLWMVAFDPAKAAAGDPSFPAFWLPFQDITSGNHIGQWSTQVVRANCTGTGRSTCRVEEVCVNNHCQPG